MGRPFYMHWLPSTLAVLSLGLGGCGRLIATIDHPLAPAPVAVRGGPLQTFYDLAPANVSVYPAGLTLGAGGSQTFSVKALDQEGNAVSGPVTFESLSTSTVAVGADGTLKAIAPGDADVVVSVGGTAVMVPVTVEAAAASLRANEVRIGGPSALRVDAFGPLPQPLKVETKLPGEVTWRSSEPRVATVDAKGVVTVKANGNASLTAVVAGVGSLPVELTVKQRPFKYRLTGADGQKAIETTAQGDAVALTAQVEDANATPIALDGYRVDVPGVASVDKFGKARPKASGQTLIRPLAAGLAGPDRAALTYAVAQSAQPTPMSAGGMDVTPGRFSLPVGARQLLYAQARDASGAVIQPAFSYSVEPADVASVDANGTVTGLKPGLATIHVKGFRASRAVAVTVTEAASTPVRIDGATEIAVASLGKLPMPLRASVGGVSWESSDATIASVDGAGQVTALKDGTVTIAAVRGGDRAELKLTVDQRPAYLAVHDTLPGDPREVVLQKAMAAFGLSATAFDFNGNAMAIERFVSDNDNVALATREYARTYSGGSAYVRAVCKGVRSSNANSVFVVSMAPFSGSRPSGSQSNNAGGPTYSVQVQQAAVALSVGGNLTLTVTVRDQSGNLAPGVTPNFDSDDPTIATVDANGKITGVAVGSANVTVSVNGGSVVVPVTVSMPATPNLVVNPVALSTNALGAIAPQLTYTTNLGGVPTWSSSDTSVATVDNAGNVTAVGNGTATVTAAIGATSTPVTVTVDQRASFVRVDGPGGAAQRSYSLFPGDALAMTATIKDANGNAMTPTSWTITGDPGVATVDAAGNVSIIGAGSAFVRVETRGSVTSTDAQSIAINSSTRTLSVNPNPYSADRLGVQPTKLTVTTNQTPVSLVSSDTSVVTVAADGTITALKNGTANITVTAGAVMAPVVVPVTVKQVTSSVEVNSALPGNPRTIVFSKTGDTVQLTALAKDPGGTAITIPGWITWSSSNPGVATVDPATGLVTVVGDGTTVITATSTDGVTSTGTQALSFTVDINNAGSVDTTINLP